MEEIRRGSGDSIESHSVENTFYRSKEIQYRRHVEEVQVMKQKRLQSLYNQEKLTFAQQKRPTIHKKKRLTDSKRDLM
jgi:hypothetical protein